MSLGRNNEALGMLRPLLPAGLAEQDRLLVRAFLGQAEAAIGNLDAAKMLFAAARALSSAQSGLMRRVLDKLDGDRRSMSHGRISGLGPDRIQGACDGPDATVAATRTQLDPATPDVA